MVNKLRYALPILAASFVLVLCITPIQALGQSAPQTLTLQLVNIAPFDFDPDECPSAPVGTFLFFWESSNLQNPNGELLGTATHCHYMVTESFTENPFPQWVQLAYGVFDLGEGTISVWEYVNSLGVSDGVFQVVGDVEGGTGVYDGVTGSLHGGGPRKIDDVDGIHLNFPFVFSLWN